MLWPDLYYIRIPAGNTKTPNPKTMSFLMIGNCVALSWYIKSLRMLVTGIL